MLGVAKSYDCRPSSFFKDMDEYTAYCFDEACALIAIKMQDGEKPSFEKKVKGHFKNFSDYYSQLYLQNT